VIVAVWDVVTAAALTVKLALVAPADTETEAGTVTLALLPDRVTEAPPLGAAVLNVAVQVAVPGVLIVVGVHVSDVMVVVVVPVPVMVPPVPDNVRAEPVGSEANVFVTLTDVLATLEPIVMFTTATTPFAIIVEFMPVARHV
jgi:hypothetical protein